MIIAGCLGQGHKLRSPHQPSSPAVILRTTSRRRGKDYDRWRKAGGAGVCRRNRRVSLPTTTRMMQDAKDIRQKLPPPSHPRAKGKTPQGEPHQPRGSKTPLGTKIAENIDKMSEGKHFQEQLQGREVDAHLVRSHKETPKKPKTTTN